MKTPNNICLFIFTSVIILMVTAVASGQTLPYYGYLVGEPMPMQTEDGMPYVLANFELPVSD